jgi:hypothetical protein
LPKQNKEKKSIFKFWKLRSPISAKGLLAASSHGGRQKGVRGFRIKFVASSLL